MFLFGYKLGAHSVHECSMGRKYFKSLRSITRGFINSFGLMLYFSGFGSSSSKYSSELSF